MIVKKYKKVVEYDEITINTFKIAFATTICTLVGILALTNLKLNTLNIFLGLLIILTPHLIGLKAIHETKKTYYVQKR